VKVHNQALEERTGSECRKSLISSDQQDDFAKKRVVRKERWKKAASRTAQGRVSGGGAFKEGLNSGRLREKTQPHKKRQSRGRRVGQPKMARRNPSALRRRSFEKHERPSHNAVEKNRLKKTEGKRETKRPQERGKQKKKKHGRGIARS